MFSLGKIAVVFQLSSLRMDFYGVLLIVGILIGAVILLANYIHRTVYWDGSVDLEEEKSQSNEERRRNLPAALEEQLESLKRSCWLPVTRDGESDPYASKFGGIPFIPSGEKWPRCGNCDEPMPLFLQCSASDLPIELPSCSGDALQFFYCTGMSGECEQKCDAWLPHSKSTLLRWIDTSGECGSPTGSPVEDPFPEKTIESWREQEDYPALVELEELGIEVPRDLVDEVADYFFPEPGDKLLGWPAWVQGVEYPDCSLCGKRMILLFQLDSEDHLPYMFGDAGTGHITQCPDHPEQLAFAWACA
jgi:hypothetical protein